MWLTRVSIKNPYFAAVMMLLVLVLGIFSLSKLPVEEFPDIRFPIAVVSVAYPGASPEVVESEVTRPLEESLNTIGGIKHIRSYSFENSAVIVVEFELSMNPDLAVQDVRDKATEVAGRFRREIKAPTISKFDPNDEAMISLTFSATEIPARDLTNWVDVEIKRKLQTIDGVGDVKIVGGVAREVKIQIDPLRLEALGLSVNQVAQAITGANRDFPAGQLHSDGRDLSLRLGGKLKTVKDFENIVVQEKAGSMIRLSDVAQVKDTQAEVSSLALFNGKPAIGLDIRAARGVNIVEVAHKVKERLAEINTEMPKSITMYTTYDKSMDVENSLREVQKVLLEGVVLTVLIVFLFLGSWRSTVITGLTLPISLLGTFFALHMMGFSLNMMTLMALSLSIGLLIDDAIVVRENIVRHVDLGYDHYKASLLGTEEIGMAVLATTLTIVAVFLPVGFMEGIIGKFFHQFGLAVTAAVVISLFVSFTLDPMLSSIWKDPHHHGDKHKGPIGAVLDWFESSLDRLSTSYTKVIRWALAHRKTVLGISLVMLIGSFMLVPIIGGEFVPKQDKGQYKVTIRAASGSNLEFTTEKALQVESVLREVYPNTKMVDTKVGGGRFGASQNEASLLVDIGPKNQRTESLDSVMNRVRDTLEDKVNGIDIVSLSAMGQNGPGGKPINIGVRGPDRDDLTKVSREIEMKLAKIQGVSDIESSLSASNPAKTLRIKRDEAAALGVDLGAVGDTLSKMIAGSAITTWEAPNGENYDVRIGLAKAAKDEMILSQLTISGRPQADGSLAQVPLSSVVSVVDSVSPKQLDRVDLEREVTVLANIKGNDSNLIFTQVDEMLKTVELPSGVELTQGGEKKSMQESGMYALQALLMGMVFIYLVLAAQFRSFTLPVTIMVALPLSFVGVFVALLLWGSTLNMFSVIGIIMLMGLASKNGILIVDFIHHSRASGLNRTEAIVEAGRVRLRPIMMTSLAMIFGMLPLALATGDGSETQRPMAQAIIGGIITSTILTLVVLPVVYTYLDGFRSWIRRRILKIETPALDAHPLEESSEHKA